MEALRELFLSLGLDADEASFASATAAVDLLEKGLELAVEAARALGDALVETVVGAVEYADKIGDAAVKTGVSTTALQELEYAAVQSGSSFDGVVQSLVFLNRSMYEAATSGGDAAASFAALGIAVRDSTGAIRDPALVHREIATAIAQMTDPAKRTALAMRLLGKSGAESIVMLSNGADGLKRFADEAHEFGAVIDEEQLSRTKAFADSWASMEMVFRNLRNEMGGMLVDELVPLVDEFRDWYAANRDLIKLKLKAFIDGVRWAIKTTAKVVESFVSGLRMLITVAQLAAVALGSYFAASAIIAAGSLTQLLVNLALNTAAAIAYGTASVGAALSSAAAWLVSVAPVLLLAAAIFLAVVAVQDLYKFFTGADSMIGDFGRKWTAFLDSWLADDTGDSWLETALKAVIWMLTDITERFPKAIAEWKDMIVKFFTETIPNAVKEFTAKFPGLSTFFQSKGEAQGAPALGDVVGGGASGQPPLLPAQSSSIYAPDMRANFVIQQQPGQSSLEVGDEMERRWNQMMEAELARSRDTTD